MHDLDITIIGGGNMGAAIVAGMLNKKFVSADHITVCDHDNDKLKVLTRVHKIKTSCSSAENIPHAEWILLAVKPQHMRAVMEEIQPHLRSEQLVLSIAAGVTLSTLTDVTKHEKVVRILPNTPAQVGCGMSAWITTDRVNAGDKALVREFLQALGQEIELHTDDDIDKIGAIHGSGPGYFFYFTEALMHAALELGFSQEIAKKIAVQTLYGSGVLANESTEDPATLRSNVTSKGGCTEAALKVFEDEHVREGIIKGIHRAYKRCQEMAKEA